MKRLFSSLNRLQWKLTLSYTLVTVAAILIVLLAFLGVIGFVIFRSPIMATAMDQALAPIGQDLAADFGPQGPNRAALQAWVNQVELSGQVKSPNSNWQLDLTQLKPTLIAIVDAQGKVIAITPPGKLPLDQPIGQTLSDPNLLDPLQASLAGSTLPEERSRVVGNSGLVISAPIHTPDGPVLGAVLIQLTLPVELGQWTLIVLQAFLPVLLVITLFAAIVGTIFGYLTAHSLTRRLKAVARSADSWSQGDFSVMVRDQSGDEIGQLARRLNQMADELQNLLQSRQELATLEERNRLARDLHDSVKQQVFAATMQIGAARELAAQDPEKAMVRLDEAERLSRQAQQELAALIRELRPAALEGKGLAQALREYVTEWSTQSQIQANLRVQGERRLPLETEQALYRIAQEALSNVARHSRAEQVNLLLAYDTHQVRLEIQDNGQGFEVEQAQGKGIGLRSMAERALARSGSLEITSAPGQGARLVVRVSAGQLETEKTSDE